MTRGSSPYGSPRRGARRDEGYEPRNPGAYRDRGDGRYDDPRYGADPGRGGGKPHQRPW